MRHFTLPRLALVMGLLLAGLAIAPAREAQAVIAGQLTGFPLTLLAQRVGWGPVQLADVDQNGRPEIVVGTRDGWLFVVRANGSILCSRHVGAELNAAAQGVPSLNQSAVPAPIRGAPAVADLTGDGKPEIVVPMGDAAPANYHGGLTVLNNQCQTLPGWPRINRDFTGTGFASGQPDGFADGVVSSPAVGDITGDGKPEIVHGSFEQFFYARDVAGNPLPGWPINALDTVWSSPALADLDGNGVMEMVIGVDAHEYNGPPRPSDDGGELYVLRGDGSIMWRAPQDEIMQSSPAIADLDGDGRLEIASGTGTYYGDLGYKNGQGVRVGQYFSVWNHDGSLRWRTALPDRVFGSPAIGDVTGDSDLEVVVSALDGKIYTFDGASGAILWAKPVKDMFDNYYILQDPSQNPPKLFSSPVLGDYTGDGKDDVFQAIGWDVAVLRGTDGAALTGSVAPPNGTFNDDPRPMYHTDYSVLSTPAVGDLNGDGKLELVAASGLTNENKATVNVWTLPSSSAKASWPMFRHDPAHSARVSPKILRSSVSSLGGLLTPGQTRSFTIAISAGDGGALSWSASKGGLQNVAVTFSRTSGDQNDTLRVTIDPGASGNFSGTVTLSAGGFPSLQIPISGKVVNNVEERYLPSLSR